MLVLAAATLGGCTDFMRAIGREKTIPDEFAVVSRAPLAVPPDFALRPPRYGAQRPQEVAPVDQARQTVFRAGDDPKAALPPAAEQRSPGEGELLKEAGAATAQPDIRKLIDTEASGEVTDSFVDKLAFWRAKDQKLGPTDTVIDPVAEADRLQASKDEPNATTQQAPAALAGTPTIERTKAGNGNSGGWFGWLF